MSCYPKSVSGWVLIVCSYYTFNICLKKLPHKRGGCACQYTTYWTQCLNVRWFLNVYHSYRSEWGQECNTFCHNRLLINIRYTFEVTKRKQIFSDPGDVLINFFNVKLGKRGAWWMAQNGHPSPCTLAAPRESPMHWHPWVSCACDCNGSSNQNAALI